MPQTDLLILPWHEVYFPTKDPAPPYAVVILAGGKGSRLGLHGPKALFSPFGDKTMLDLLLERIDPSIPVAMMIDPEAKPLFASETRIFIFTQSQLPLLSVTKKPFVDPSGNPVMAPDGNGSLFSSLAKTEFIPFLEKKGVEHLVIASIDNILAPHSFSPLAAFCQKADSDWAILACIREGEKNAGVLCNLAGKLHICDYMEIAENTFDDFPYMNAGIYALQVKLAKQLASYSSEIHLAKKEYKFPDTNHTVSVYKQERFIFDLLPFAKNAKALCMEKEKVFAPIKTPADVKKVRSLNI